MKCKAKQTVKIWEDCIRNARAGKYTCNAHRKDEVLFEELPEDEARCVACNRVYTLGTGHLGKCEAWLSQ